MKRGLPITYTLAPDDADVRPVRSPASRKLGHPYIGSIGRAVLISEAGALEGQKAIPRVIPEAPEIIVPLPGIFVNYFRASIDPGQAESIDKAIVFGFGEKGKAGSARPAGCRGFSLPPFQALSPAGCEHDPERRVLGQAVSLSNRSAIADHGGRGGIGVG